MVLGSRLLFLIVVVFSLNGCVGGPRSVEATVDLVDETSYHRKKALPEKYWSALNKAEIQQNVVLDDKPFLVTSSYVSALGHLCKTLHQESRNNGSFSKRVVCQPLGFRFWYMVPNINSSKHSVAGF